MVVWKFEDDCFAPERLLRIDFKGPNPFKIALAIRGLLEEVFEVEAVDLWERDFRWDSTGDPRGFYMRIYVSKGFDAFTSIFVGVTIQGAQPSDVTKDGEVTVRMEARISTNYNLSTFIQKLPVYKAIRWLYHYIFYSKVRRGYLALCNELSEKLLREARAVLGMPQSGGY